MRNALAYLVLSACGGGGQSPVDAGPDAPDGPVTFVPVRYVMDSQSLPQDNTEARDLGLDLDGDAVIDNQLGMVLGTLSGQGLDSQVSLTTAIDRGDILMLVELSLGGSFSDGPMTFTQFSGANPQPPACSGPGDTVCRRHFDGLASFDVAANSARDTPLAGQLSGGTGTTNSPGGELQLQTTILSGTPVAIDLLGARVRIDVATQTAANGVIGGAITRTDVDTKVLPAMQVSTDARVQQDCPGAPPDCSCTPNTTGDTLQGLFDTAPVDCAISLDEIKNNSLIQSLLAPDVTVNGQDALSIGVGFTAVVATFVP